MGMMFKIWKGSNMRSIVVIIYHHFTNKKGFTFAEPFPFKSVRLKFFQRSAEKLFSRTDPDHDVYRELRVIFPGAYPGNRVQFRWLSECPGVHTI